MQQMDKFQSFERGTYVTNGNMSGIVKTYSLNSGYDVNDGSFRGMDDSEINEFNQILLKNGYIWGPRFYESH